MLLRYIERMTGLSRQQVTRLVRQYCKDGKLSKQPCAPKQGFTYRYTAADVALLAEMDVLHSTLSGPATKKLMERAHQVFGDPRYERLAGISISHLYNLRGSKTRPTGIPIGKRRAPQPNGVPGYIRIDSVHQGDLDGVKGVYHINAVDCVTQMQFVATCEKISEAYLLPVIRQLLAGFPFVILGFHSDNGSEYVNYQVAKLLEKLRVEFTKSRPRHSNDNALAESKNAAVVRKHLGYAHIPQHCASLVNAFCAGFLNPYVNFHRPCFFPETITDAKGKERKKYRYEDMMTPYEKLKSIPEASQYLKDGVMPVLQEAAHSHRRTISKPDQVGLLYSVLSCPFIECICRHQHSDLAVCVAKHRLDGSGFGLGVYGVLYLLRVFHPGRDQSPFGESEYAIACLVETNYRNRLARRNVEARLQLRLVRCIEMFLELGG